FWICYCRHMAGFSTGSGSDRVAIGGEHLTRSLPLPVPTSLPQKSQIKTLSRLAGILDCDTVDAQSRSRGTLQVGQRFVVICFGLQFVRAGRSQLARKGVV